jgi:ABC-2 type transport system permease protein
LTRGDVDVVVDGDTLFVDESPVNATSATAGFVEALATQLGEARAVTEAGLSASQLRDLEQARPFAIHALRRAKPTHSVNAAALLGDILIFTMLSQYNTWTLFGVMEEKASRVIEVLLSAVRPLQLLGGKVIGIGVVALAQAITVAAFAAALASVVGSSVVRGTSWSQMLITLLWLVLGYAFYSWVYAAAGSLAERQDQVQTLVLPLTLPMLLGYVTALLGASAGAPSLLMKVLSYLPPTAPFEMPVLLSMHAVTWWQVALSVACSLVATVLIARLAATIYRRAILRTGGRVRWRDVLVEH